MCENSTEIVLCNLIDAIWDDNEEEVGICLLQISLKSEMKEEIIKRSSDLPDKRITERIAELLN